MKILVLGASGGVGQHVVPIARSAGHDVVALVRPRTFFQETPGTTVVRADPLDGVALRRALGGVDAVISCVGMKRANPANPWSKSLSPANLTSSLAHHLVEAMGEACVKRVVAVSAAGVGDSAPRLNVVMRFMLATTVIGVAYRDLALMEDILSRSTLDWLAPRPTRLTHGPRTDRVRTVDAFEAMSSIARADVAAFMVNALAVPEWPAPGWGTRTPQISAG